MDQLRGQSYLVTGASSGIGESVARKLAKCGARVALMARRHDRIAAIAKELNQHREGSAAVCAGDVGAWTDCESAVEKALATLGGLNGLVNAAGAWYEDHFADLDPQDLDKFVSTDVVGALQVTRSVLPCLRDSGGGTIVHINGLQGRDPSRAPVVYAAVENAVRGLCESLRWEARAYEVRIGLITLGAVANEEPDDFQSGSTDGHGRISISRGEVAEAIIYMLSRPPHVNIDELVMTPLHQE